MSDSDCPAEREGAVFSPRRDEERPVESPMCEESSGEDSVGASPLPTTLPGGAPGRAAQDIVFRASHH